MADESHTQMLIQPQPPPPQQQQQMQQQQQQLQQAQMQPQLQQQQMQQQQLPQQQLQQSAMQQQPPQQTVAATMPMGNSVEQNSHMNVTTSVPINVATINVSQPQMQTLQQTVNTSAGGSVQMAVPQLTAQAQTVQAGSMMSQSSAPHTTMIHPTMTMAQSPLQQVQVMQQPLSASYLQHLYPQQQLLFPGNLTLQHAGMTGPTLQSIGATQGLSLQLQAKTTLDPKTSIGGQTLQAVNANKAMAVNTGTMMTTSGQVIGAATQKANFPQQMITIPGKQTITHSQTGFNPAAQNQTVVIGQLGVIPNQQSIFNQKAMTDSQKGKTFTFHNQQATLQPKSLYSSTLPVHSTAQVFNGSHMKPIGTQSQILTSQTPATMLGNAQIFGVSPFPQGFSWSAGNLQLAQNQPIIIQRQQSTDMYIQSPSQSAMQIPVAAATAPIPPTTYAPTPLAPSKPKQVRFATQTVAVATQTIVTTAATMNSNTTPVRAQVRPKGRYSAASSPIAPSANAPRMATTQTQTNQSHSQHPSQLPPNAQQKSDAGNQTQTGQVKPVTPLESKSISTQSKSVGVETKQHLSPQPPLKSQAMVAPSTKAQNTVSPTISTSLPSVTTSCDVMTTTTSTVSSTVTPTNTVLPSMPIITTYAAVAPTPSPITSVAAADSMTVAPKRNASVLSEGLEEDVDDPPECDPVEMAECEPLKPQPMLKPNLSPVKEKQPQKAIVKPQILTHVIDGFVIQEGPEPFPVSRSALLDSSYRVMPPEKLKRIDESPTAASPEKKRNTVHRPRGNVELAKCEFCGKMGPKYKFKRSKRFCSTSCAKRYNVCYSKRVGLLPSSNQENVAAGRKKKQGYKGRRGRKPSLTDQDLGISPVQMEVVPETTTEEPLLATIKVEEEVSEVSMDATLQNVTPVEKAEDVEVVEVESSVMQKLPSKWTVQDVFEFIRDLPGCSDYADTFKSQEIDGQALLLLREDHVTTLMSMKLGPAVKLISEINSIKERLGQSKQKMPI